MPQFTIAERQFLVEYYFKSFRYGRNNGPSLKWTSQQFSLTFDKKPPVKSCLLDIIRKFKDTGSVGNDNKCNSGRKTTIRTNENHGIILEKVLRSPKKSRRRLSKELGISRSSVNRMIKDIGAFSYKIQILQTLQPQDPHQRFDYATRFLAHNYADGDFVENIWFSDECHVLLSGHVNKQNMRFLGWERPEEYAQRPLHSQKVTVWCAVSSHGILGPYFLEDANGKPSTITSMVYRDQVIDRFVGDLQLFCELNSIPYDTQWFQQDGAICHTGRGNLAYLEELFPGRLITRLGEFPYPPRSPDMTPPDYFLWGHLKELCFCDPVPRTIDELKTNIIRVISGIRQETLTSLFDNMLTRLELCVDQNGGHFEHLLK